MDICFPPPPKGQLATLHYTTPSSTRHDTILHLPRGRFSETGNFRSETLRFFLTHSPYGIEIASPRHPPELLVLLLHFPGRPRSNARDGRSEMVKLIMTMRTSCSQKHFSSATDWLTKDHLAALDMHSLIYHSDDNDKDESTVSRIERRNI